MEAVISYATIFLVAKVGTAWFIRGNKPGIINVIAFRFTVKVAHELLSETFSNEPRRLSGTKLVQELTNRTYKIASETISFDEDAFRLPKILLKQFDDAHGTFKVSVHHDEITELYIRWNVNHYDHAEDNL